MQLWKVLLGAAVLVAVLVALMPQRSVNLYEDSEDVVEITYMAPGGLIASKMTDVIRAFERKSYKRHQEDPDYPIYKVITGQSGAQDMVGDPTRFLISVAGGMPPDVIYFDRFAVAEWAARGAFMPLDSFIENDIRQQHPNAIDPSRFYQTCWDEACFNDVPYSIPNGVDDRALFYRKDLFRKAGIVDENGNPTPPRTWEELKDYAIRLTEYDAKGNVKVLGFAPNYGNAYLYFYGWMNAGRFMSADGTQCTLNHPRIVEALQYMVDVYDAVGGYEQVQAFQASFQGGTLDPFITGKIAMKLDGYWVLPFMAQFGRDVDFGIAAPPVSQRMIEAGTRTVTWNGGWSYAIPYNAKNKEAAWEFIRFAVSDEAWEIFMESDREMQETQGRLFLPLQVPIRDLNERFIKRYVTDNPRIPENIKHGVRVFTDLLPKAKFRPITPVGQLLWQWHVNATETACYKKQSPQQALDYATQQVQRELDKQLVPPRGEPIRDWSFFFIGYALLILLLGLLAYYWDTSVIFRRGLTNVFRRRRTIDVGDVVVGARGGYFRQQWWAGFLFVSPWVIGFIIFAGGPMLYSVVMSFCDYDVIKPARWVGLENYRIMLFEDQLIGKAFYNTFFMVLGVPLMLIVSLAIALLLNQKIRGISVWRTIFYLPSIVPGVATFILFIWIFNPRGGIINGALELVGVDGPSWLQNEYWSKPSLILMSLWGAGGSMLIWLAGLKGISEHYYEAASIDGANDWQQFRHITLPMISPYIFFNLVMGMIAVFQIFDPAFVMTQGGPVNSTLFYVYHLFNNAFRYGHMGYASALAWVLFAVIMIFTVVQLRYAKRWVHYEAD